jgi:hypothetical protein
MTSAAVDRNPTDALDDMHSRLAALAAGYRSADPYPHTVIDDFLDPALLRRAAAEFPAVTDDWIHYAHVNEQKFGQTSRARFPGTLGAIVDALNSDEFVSALSALTGIEGLVADPALEGGGLHQSERGGFLNVHADFTVHPHHRDWRRRINVLVYLNEDWRDEYGGHLELWDRGMARCVRRVLPVFNRAVIFNTDPDSFHGHPDPLTCPEGRTRKSIALYYFTKDAAPSYVRSTEYRPRPADGFKRVWIRMDTLVLRGYDRAKRVLHIDDRFASGLLRRLSARRRPPRT